MQTNEYYLNVHDYAVVENDLIKIDIDNKNAVRKIVDRYNVRKRVNRCGENKWFHVVDKQHIEMLNNFSLPELVDDAQCGWHRIIRKVGNYSFDEISQIEKNIKGNYTHNVFITQMTAHYSVEPITIIETPYSDGLLVFIFDIEHSILFVMFYFQGDTIDNIPFDMMHCIKAYGKHTIDKPEEQSFIDNICENIKK